MEEVDVISDPKIINDLDEKSSSVVDAKEGTAEEEKKVEVAYPLQVVYCGNCGLPPEYCEFFPNYDKCRIWLEANLPSELEKVAIGGGTEEEKKGRQKRGGKGLVKPKKAGKAGPKRICVYRAPRGKKKSVTVVTGLGAAGIDLKVAAKYLATKFACGSSVTGDDEIVIQGDVKDDLFDVLPEKWPEIDEDCIDDLGDQKR